MEPLKVGALVFPGFELLGLCGPLEMLGMYPDAFDIRLVARSREPVASAQGPVSVPEGLIDQIGLGLAKLILAGDEFVEINQIRVSDGTLTLSGGYRR